MAILHKALIRCAAIGVFLTGLLVGHATIPVRAQPAAIRVNNNTMGLFIDPPTTRYHNFGTTLGANGFGIRELAGVMQAKDDGGTWVGIGVGAAIDLDTLCFSVASPDVCLSRSAAGTLQFAAVGLTNNEIVTFDLETTANEWAWATSTGVTNIANPFDLTMATGTQVFLDDGTESNPGLAFTGATTNGFYRASNRITYVTLGADRIGFDINDLALTSGGFLGWASGPDPTGDNADLRFFRDAADTSAQRRGTNAQTERLYETFTDSSNNQGLAIDAGVSTANTVTLTPFENGTGADNQNLVLASLGATGEVHFDTQDVIRVGIDGTRHDGYVLTNPAEVTTTDATVTVLDNFTLLDENTYQIEALIVGVQSDGTNRASYHLAATVYRTSAGAATIQGAVTSLHTQESDANWDAVFTVSSNDVRVSVTGVAATTVQWGSTLTYINMSN